MKQNIKSKKIRVRLCLSVVSIFFLTTICFAQTKPLIKRTTYKTDTVEFGVGATVSVIGAPNGSITIEGWQNNTVEISAEVEMQAETEADLAELAKVSGYVLDNDFSHLRITSIGTYDKKYLKRVAKNFPKKLLNLPFRVDYHIKVPVYSDLEIDGGKGDLNLSNVEGVIKINFLESNAKLNLIGGAVLATFGGGNVEIVIPNRSWRGRSADVQLATGTMNVQLPINLNADVDAKVLRVGTLENTLKILKPRPRTTPTEKSIEARAGNGGAPLSFVVGDGNLKLVETEK